MMLFQQQKQQNATPLASTTTKKQFEITDFKDIPKILSAAQEKGGNSPMGPNFETPIDTLDSVIADAMSQLSVTDREKVVHEIHGVSDGIEESPEFLAHHLMAMNEHLTRIRENPSNLPTAAYELAESISKSYVKDPKFRKSFLRTEDYNTKLAAERFILHFDYKFCLFGGAKLCKDITYDDLDQYDKFALDKGWLQALPVRDRAGRAISVFFPDKQEYHPDTPDIGACYGRMVYYLNHAAVDEHSQTRGLIQIVYSVGKVNPDRLYPEVPPVFLKMLKSQPTKFCSWHFCFSNPLMRIVFQNASLLLGNKLRAATKCHQGSQQEVMYQLMTYGIPTDMIPVNFDNEIKRSNHLELIKMLKAKEDYVAKHGKCDNCIVIPYANDVLCGKGGPNQNSPGNMKLKATVDELLPMYNSLEKEDKIELARQVLAVVKESGGRFLSKESDVWMVIDDKIARSKIATLFRNRRKASQKVAAQKAVQANIKATPKAPRSGSFAYVKPSTENFNGQTMMFEGTNKRMRM